MFTFGSRFDNGLPSYFARVNFRESKDIFGIKQADRLLHMYVVGKTGVGKTSLLKVLMDDDTKALPARGFAFFDPHGDAYQSVLNSIPFDFKHRTIPFNLASPDLPFGYNPLRKVSPLKHSLVASSILEIFRRNWKSAWGLKMEHILRHILLTLLCQPKADFSDIPRILQDQSFRRQCLIHISNSDIKRFWELEFPKYKPNDLLPILNKVGAFLAHPIVRKILVENTQQISFRKIMDESHILLINLSKGAVGSDVANILGNLLLVSLASAAYSRIDTAEENRVPFFIYIDEFQTMSGADLLSELLAQIRKFKIGIVLANQYISQLDNQVRDAVLGNVGTIICFRLGIQDARLMEKEFYPIFKAIDFISLANYEIYLKLMIDGRPSQPFSAITIL